MRKSEIKFICVVLAIAMCLTTLTACSIGGNGGGTGTEGGSTEDYEIVVDNTGANTVTEYDTNGAYSLNIDAGDEIHDISDLLFGAFFEDINFAADGGLYAEMVVNRSFEYTYLAEGDELYRWSSVNGAGLKVDYLPNHSLNENNPHYLILSNTAEGTAGVENSGFLDGMSITEGETYNMSFYAKSKKGYEGNFYINLAVNGTVVASSTVSALSLIHI